MLVPAEAAKAAYPGRRMGARRASLAALAVAAVATSALTGACRAFVGPSVPGRTRGAVFRAATAAGATKATTKVNVPLYGGESQVTEEFWVSKKMGKNGKVEVAKGMLPLGLSIVKDEELQAWVIEEIIQGGSAAMGVFPVGPGDVLHAMTVMDGEKKAVLEAGKLETVAQLTEAILSNTDGEISLVLETEAPGGGDSGFGWVDDVTRVL